MHEALADAQDAPRPLGHRFHLQGVLDRIGDGLLHRDVLARLERRDHVGVVQVGRGAHLDRVANAIRLRGIYA